MPGLGDGPHLVMQLSQSQVGQSVHDKFRIPRQISPIPAFSQNGQCGEPSQRRPDFLRAYFQQEMDVISRRSGISQEVPVEAFLQLRQSEYGRCT
ncbi:hypothetical protein GCM10010384_30930 [Streptomyces djakartensis]|uniref:Uncharacterized protein n=1 Tax=Streptomyces djakartensis TaxID=68193 RepID=A0ABQ2ZQS7_9ACTN|nr:hypothetical protein GCM10010384_30930 [Streptomyces djakartensis]